MNDELVALTEAATELVSNQPGYAIKCQQKDDGTVEVIEWGEGITPPSDSDLATKKAEKLAKIVNNKYQLSRKEEYPDWGTQLDYIYHNGIDKWKTDIVDPVKAKYPKPS
tara:strand:+ start:1448 stop:1777 length:330 start_codon:yes stop_codon:yes gene_type:complete